MIYFVELQMQGDKHVHVNSGLLKILTQALPDSKIKIFCDEKHKMELSKYILSEQYNYNSFKYTGIKELSKKKILHKVIRECVLAYRIFSESKKNGVESIVFASLFPFTALIINAYAKLFHQQIIVCLHGDIGVLSLKSRKFTIAIFRKSIEFFFKFRVNETTVLFYGQSIKETFFKQFPSYRKDKIIAIDHPYNYDYPIKINNIRKDNVLVGSIGTGLINKNSHLLFKVAELQKKNILDGKIKFFQIGHISPEVLSYQNKHVEIVNQNKFITFDTFEENIGKADYFIYFFSEGSYYDLCPSGTFFDAIRYGKPIISLHNPFFNYYFDKLGNIGYLCHSIEEMNNIIERIAQKITIEEYLDQLNNLKRAANILSTENIAISFQKQYIDIYGKRNFN